MEVVASGSCVQIIEGGKYEVSVEVIEDFEGNETVEMLVISPGRRQKWAFTSAEEVIERVMRQPRPPTAVISTGLRALEDAGVSPEAEYVGVG